MAGRMMILKPWPTPENENAENYPAFRLLCRDFHREVMTQMEKRKVRKNTVADEWPDDRQARLAREAESMTADLVASRFPDCKVKAMMYDHDRQIGIMVTLPGGRRHAELIDFPYTPVDLDAFVTRMKEWQAKHG